MQNICNALQTNIFQSTQYYHLNKLLSIEKTSLIKLKFLKQNNINLLLKIISRGA